MYNPRQPIRMPSPGRPKDVPRKILILLDSPMVRSEVTTYSVELARRMGAMIHLLMLLRWEAAPPSGTSPTEMGSEGEEARKEAELVVKDCIAEIRGCGVETQGAVQQGDPSSELLKYLAEHQPFHAVVWGGNEKFLRRRRTPVRTHWLERIRDQLDCALVVPSLKREKTGVG
jgi:hypothetical protein